MGYNAFVEPAAARDLSFRVLYDLHDAAVAGTSCSHRAIPDRPGRKGNGVAGGDAAAHRNGERRGAAVPLKLRGIVMRRQTV